MATPKQTVVKFARERDTKNKVRYEEVAPKDSEDVIGKLYISKETVEELGNPETIEVTVKAAGK